jgi:hypothetical protein
MIYHTGIWSKTSRGISVSGIESHISNNEIFDMPYDGINLTSSNNNIVEYNNIYDVMKLANDGAGIYVNHHWIKRGTIFRYNYVHDISGKDNLGAAGIYLDDTGAGSTVWGNVIANISIAQNMDKYNAASAIILGGGRDNIIENNITVNTPHALYWGVWYKNTAEAQGIIDQINYKVTPFTTMYPELTGLNNASELFQPLGSTIKNNIFAQSYGNWYKVYLNGIYEHIVDIRDNFTGNPGFTNTPIGNFGVPSNSSAFATGFKPIPYERIELLEKTSINFTSNKPGSANTIVPASNIVATNSNLTNNNQTNALVITAPNTSAQNQSVNVPVTPASPIVQSQSVNALTNKSTIYPDTSIKSGTTLYKSNPAKPTTFKSITNLDNSLLIIPTTTIDIVVPKVPSWLEVLIALFKEIANRIKMGAQKTWVEVGKMV